MPSGIERAGMTNEGVVRARAAVIAAVVAAVLAVVPTRAQHVGEAAGWVNRDYFLKDSDPEVSLLVSKVERAHLAKANFFKWYDMQEWSYAIGDLQYALWVFPNHPKALYFMGVIAKDTNQYSLPIKYFQNAITLFPQHALTHAQYGSYLVDIGDAERGMERLSTALKLDPNLAVGHAWLAKAYFKAGRVAEGRAEVAKARQLGFKGIIEGERPHAPDEAEDEDLPLPSPSPK